MRGEETINHQDCSICRGKPHYSLKPAKSLLSVLIMGLAVSLSAGYVNAAEAEPLGGISAVEGSGVTPDSISQKQIKDIIPTQSTSVSGKPADEAVKAGDVDNANISGKPTQAPAKPEMSDVERLLSSEIPSESPVHLTQFGYDVFQKPVSTFAPVTNVPVGPDYIVGPGDTFTVTLWGRVNAQYTVEIDRNGQIVLPEVPQTVKCLKMAYAQITNPTTLQLPDHPSPA